MPQRFGPTTRDQSVLFTGRRCVASKTKRTCETKLIIQMSVSRSACESSACLATGRRFHLSHERIESQKALFTYSWALSGATQASLSARRVELKFLFQSGKWRRRSYALGTWIGCARESYERWTPTWSLRVSDDGADARMVGVHLCLHKPTNLVVPNSGPCAFRSFFVILLLLPICTFAPTPFEVSGDSLVGCMIHCVNEKTGVYMHFNERL